MSVQEFADEDEALTLGVTPEFRWAVGRNTETGLAFFANSKGQRTDFPPDCVAHIAAALSELCRDPDDRSFVADEWGPVDAEYWDDEEAEGGAA